MRLVYVFVMVLYLFVCFQKTSRQNIPAQRKRKMKSLPSPKTRDQARLSPWYCRSRNCTEWTICNRHTSSIACNEHIQTVMGQQKMQNLSHDWPNVEPMLWAKDGPMSKRYVGPFKIYHHGPIVRRPMCQWRANVYVLSGRLGCAFWSNKKTCGALVSCMLLSTSLCHVLMRKLSLRIPFRAMGSRLCRRLG